MPPRLGDVGGGGVAADVASWLILAPALAVNLACSFVAAAQQTESAELLKSDSRAPYIHRITLYDHDGRAIRPTDIPALPYSPRATCGKCHPYGEIAHGLHFNANDPKAPAGRPGEPWFLIDEKTGSVIPVSARGWPGTVTPADAGLTDWEMVKRFGRHMPGGGFGEPRAPGHPRWQVSGPLEIDCMICHSADQQHDPAEVARQIEKENFRWAATAALGLGVVRGEARRAPDDWDPDMPPDPDFPERAGPTLIYDKTRFDPDDRVLFQITRRVPNDRCYFCHTKRLVGSVAPETWHTDQDVHIAVGLMCVDCHRHGIDHAMTRGYEGESQHPARVARTCRGCHLGDENSREIATALGGHLRAPHPQHAGLPPLHLEKLTCTACHSGPWPREQVQQMQTAPAHELGLPMRQRPADLPPIIIGPLFARDDDEQPIGTYVAALAGASRADSQDESSPRQLHGGGTRAGLYRWPLAHDVRPAAQSLGVRGCDDCHSLDGPIFFGAVSVADKGRMYELHGYDPLLARVWALSFKVRPAFKWFGFACIAIMAVVVLRAMVGARPWTPSPRIAALRRPALVIMLVGVAMEAVTGFGGEWLRDEVAGWTLLAHMLGAPLFMVGLVGVAALSPAVGVSPAGSRWRKLALWTTILAGFVVTVTMLAAMLPYFGYAAQEKLAEAHGVAAYVLLAALFAWALTVRFRRTTG